MANPGQRLILATKEMVRGNMDAAFKSLTLPSDEFGAWGGPDGVVASVVIDPSGYISGAEWITTIDGNGYNYFKYTGCGDAEKAYSKCPPINAIINKKASAFINGKTWVLNARTGKEDLGKDATKLRALLHRPNFLMGWDEFEAQNYIYQQVFGFCAVLLIKPVGFKENIDASAMWNIPPNVLEIKYKKRYFDQTDITGAIESIAMNVDGDRVFLDLNNIVFIKDFTPSFTRFFLPASRISSLEMPVNNIIGAYESRNVLINYRGALGVISHDNGGGGSMGGSLPMTPTEKDDLQMDLAKYGLRKKQIQFIITKAAIKWQQMGYPTKDLMLFEEIEADTMASCDAFGYPFRLLSNISSNSLGGTDAQIFGNMLYQDTIMPESHRIYSQWNQIFGLDKYGLKLDKDFTHISVLQEDKVQQGVARLNLNQAYAIEWEKGLVTRNQWRVANGDDPIAGDDLLIGELDTKNQPLAVTIGVGGVTALIAVLTVQGLSQESRQAAMEIVFGINPADAARLAADPPQTETGGTGTQTTTSATGG